MLIFNVLCIYIWFNTAEELLFIFNFQALVEIIFFIDKYCFIVFNRTYKHFKTQTD
jgi:hypothetical protein